MDLFSFMYEVLSFLSSANGLTLISCVSAVLTLLVAIATYKVAEKSYTQIEREDPWKLTYQKDNYWLLERIHPIRATLWGYEIYNPVKKDENSVREIAYCNIHNADQIFVRGTKVLIKMPELPVGSYFTLYSSNHSKRKKFHPLYSGHYRGAVTSSTFDLISANTWTTPLC